MKKIHVIGDSHVSLFTGQDVLPPIYPEASDDKLKQFKTYRLGPVLAYNLGETGHSSQGREKLFTIIQSLPKSATIMLCFGEIDCRAHIVKQAWAQGRSLESIAKDVALRYGGVIKEVSKLRKTIVWGATPQSAAVHSSNKFPTVGTMQERNLATRYFNASVALACEGAGVGFVSIFDKLVNEKLESAEEYFLDTAHLNQKALPLALEALKYYLK